MKQLLDNRKKNLSMPHSRYERYETIEAEIDRMINEGLSGGNTEPNINGSLDYIPS